MEYFVRRAGHAMRTRVKYDDEQTVPVTALKDCLVYQTQMDIGDRFVEPGIIITQKNGQVSGRRPSGTPVFTFKTDCTLEKFIVDKNRLFALDRLGKAHIFHFNGTTPEVHDMHRHPLGWTVVPNTRMMVTWNVLTLRIADPDTHKDLYLKGHQARVTAAASASAVVATGDANGHVCVWYVASWNRFHNIKTGTECVDQIAMTDDLVAVRTRNKVYQYDITTGKKAFDLEVSARSIQYTHRGLVVAHDGIVELFVAQESSITLVHDVSCLLKSVHSRCWCVKDRHLVEMDLSASLERWPEECLRWIHQPRFPFTHTWPTHRYMDVLAISVDEWLPKVGAWEPPRPWFRHQALRKAIWTWASAHNVTLAHQWLFLPSATLQPWFQLCLDELTRRVESFAFKNHTVELLEHVYKRKRIRDESVLKWCWFHHGKMRLRPVLLRLTETDANLIDIVASDAGSPTAILCFHPNAAKILVDSGYLCTFVRLMHAYHDRFAPTDGLRRIYQHMTNFVFTAIEEDTCDVPMPDTGFWKPVKRFMPTDVGKYIKNHQSSGFVTAVAHTPDGQTVQWHPSTRLQPCELVNTDVYMWTYHFPNAPHTMFECALTLMNPDKWSGVAETVPFAWFESEVGAFQTRGVPIRIFDKATRILNAKWGDTGASIETTDGGHIRESEQLPIHTDAQEWSYLADSTYDLTPMKLKLSSIVSKKHVRLDTDYASEMMACCPADTILVEHQWDMNNAVTAATSDMKTFVIGLKTGAIYEFDSVSSFSFPVRSFTQHQTAILSLHLYEDRLLSLSDETLCIWSLKRGTLVFTTTSQEHFMTAIPYVAMHFWVVEHGDCARATLWDVEDQIPLRQVLLPRDERYIDAFHVDSLSVLVSSATAVLWSEEGIEHQYELDVEGTVTCLCETPGGIAGGSSDGSIFMLDFDTQKVMHWAALGGIVCTAMAKLDATDCLLLGDAIGRLTLWNAQTHAFEHTVDVSSSPIEHIFVESIFAFLVHAKHIKLVSIVQERASISCHCLHNIMTWSPPWKHRILNAVSTHVKPVVKACLRQKKTIATALDVVEECSEDYAARVQWCDDDLVELLFDMPMASSKLILKRLVAFKGPRIDCPICGDDETKDTVSYLTPCHHRFHTGCIAEHIQKTPEYHEQMQYEYALTVELKCPTCRAPFESHHVKLDNILNCT